VRASPAPEHELALLLCGTEERRAGREPEAEGLFQRVRESDLLALVERLNVVTLVGRRLLGLGLRPAGAVIERIEHLIAISREHEALLEVMTLSILSNLEAAGIRALPLKGSVLAREIHGDPALRSSLDIDILVPSRDLGGAAEVVRSMGWRDLDPLGAELPLLHHRMVHPTLPRIELHWRVHWYEERFAADALASATSPGSGAPLRMQPAEELASLLLFYARDGFSGLRLPADIAAWWSSRGHQLAAGRSYDAEIAARYPALAAPLGVGSAVLDALVGVPGASLDRSPLRQRAASKLANPFLLGGDSQILATASLIDLALAPPRGHLESIRRELGRAPVRRGVAPPRGSITGRLGTAEHALRFLRRWASISAGAVFALIRPRRD
jgi:Uncharacterised nucleotidyltransferase